MGYTNISVGKKGQIALVKVSERIIYSDNKPSYILTGICIQRKVHKNNFWLLLHYSIIFTC